MKFKFKELLMSLLVFSFSRFFSIFIIFSFLKLYDSRFITYSDLAYYSKSDLNFNIANPFFAILTRVLGYSPENFLDPFFIFLSFLLSIFFYIPWIFLANRLLTPKNSILYSTILGFHPYLAIYSMKINSTLFSLLPVSIYYISLFTKNFKHSPIPLFVTSLSSFFRNSILPLGWLQLILFFKSLGKYKSKYKNYLFLINFTLLTICSLSQYKFGQYYLTADYGCYSFNRIYERIFAFNFNETITKILTIIITPIIHFFLDLGAREGVYQFCIRVPNDLASNKFIHLSTMIFLLNDIFIVFPSQDINLWECLFLVVFS